MSKIYRIHEGAIEAVEDWTRLESYLDTAQIKRIPDPAGANTRQQITSIPSPFARIDLVKTAFQNVVASRNLNGTSIFHKMVSDSLDVGQVFFNSAELSDKIEIVSWDPGLNWKTGEMTVNDNSDLDRLLKSSSAGHRLYGDTLKMFFEQDADEYNFKQLKQFFLLSYKDGPADENIIGGTSPSTLFFSSANKLDYINFIYKNDRLFDDEYCPLHERSENYILFLYALQRAMPDFSTHFKVVDDYLRLCMESLTPDTKRKVQALQADNYKNDYASIALAGEGNHPEITGFELKGVKVDIGEIPQKSDFVIAATQAPQQLPPLVLPAYTFTGALNYIDGIWPSSLKAPFFDPRPMADRTLPGSQVKYPYLTVSDFLEPALIELPFELSDKFFNGHFPNGNNIGFLLPLSPVFFQHFTTTDLLTPLADGRHLCELEKLPGNGVKAKLHIPIKNGRFIDMERIYTPDISQRGNAEAELAKNSGVIRKKQFSLAIYPFVKRHTDSNTAYTILLLDRDMQAAQQLLYRLKYYKNTAPEEAIKVAVQRQKSNKKDHHIDTVYDIVKHEFDFMIIETANLRGCVIPKFPVKTGGHRAFSFSVDFGTTNTHIEYKQGDDELPQPLEITGKDAQIGMLHSTSRESYNNLGRFEKGTTLLFDTIPREMMPEYIGGNTKYKFPRRTVVSEPLKVDVNRETYPLADFSIYWPYDDCEIAEQLKFYSNLKWSNFSKGPETEMRMRGYLANLVLLIRNKIVLNDGDLAKTKITWFYPASMSNARRNMLESIWHRLIEEYLGQGIKVNKLPESIAPFYFFRNEGIKVVSHPVINIDIGGGTTDVVVYRDDQISSFTSFKFAGNALFGDGYGIPPAKNGFVQFFERRYRDGLKDTVLAKYIPQPKDVRKSDDFITTLFGLQDHPGRNDYSFSFTEKLRETEDLKIVPLFFISSVFYHIARYQQHTGGGIPRFITFSGTASKMLQILDVSRDFKSIAKLANLIFNDVFACQDARVELVVAPGPKEVTAKGGLYNPVVPELEKSILFGCEDTVNCKDLSYQDARDETVKAAVVKEVKSFVDRFFGWGSKINFSDEFALNTSRFPEFKKYLELGDDVKNFLEIGIEELREEMNKEEHDTINETLFFMPLKGMLNNLAFRIIDNN